MESVATTCALCNGSGWVPEPGSFRVVPCGCQPDRKRSLRKSNSSIPARYLEHCTLREFHDRNNASLTVAKRRVARLVSEFPMTEHGILLMGQSGCGKTHLAVAALVEIIELDKPGKLLFTNFQELIQQILASIDSDRAPSRSEILEPVLIADLLVLDELGSQKPTQFVQDMLYYIINTRYNEKRTTIFTTNYFDDARVPKEESLEDRIGKRLRSRLFEMAERMVIDADDYRKTVLGKRV